MPRRHLDEYTIIPRTSDMVWNEDGTFGARHLPYDASGGEQTIVTPKGNYYTKKGKQYKSDGYGRNTSDYYNGNDIIDFVNGTVLNPLQLTSPYHWLGVARHWDKNKDIGQIFDPNSGIVSENFAKEHPYLTAGINMLGDAATGQGIKRSLRYAGNVKKRAFETVMRSTINNPNPLLDLPHNIKYMWGQRPIYIDDLPFGSTDYDGRKRLYNIGKYILTGKRTGDKGYYNSFAINPEDYYTGFRRADPDEPISNIHYDRADDAVDAFLYDKIIDKRYGVKYLGKGLDFGPHSEYVAKHYGKKAKNMPFYELVNDGFDGNNAMYDYFMNKDGAWHGSDFPDAFATNRFDFFDAAGHVERFNKDKGMVMAQDIWKFLPSSYDSKYFKDMPKLKRIIAKLGLRMLDNTGTPFITKSNKTFNSKINVPLDDIDSDLPF